ncbi:hypothetical protein E2C01_017714 [Portunus trituberculatus]|uniref:Uncharacterized protein n=1 Tax=Portunus trituberculatus TaxID=210409 RepID=A0A5B7DUK9_PORTR|nr:hypothetical protein [Portunus trituberculatus]
MAFYGRELLEKELGIKDDISLKQAAEDVSECSATTQLTRQLTAVLENGAEKEEKSCEHRDDCEKQPIAETHKASKFGNPRIIDRKKREC